MLQFKAFNLSPGSVIGRFYLTMAVAVFFGVFNLWALAAIMAFAVAVSTILGISVDTMKPEKISGKRKEGRLDPLERTTDIRKAA